MRHVSLIRGVAEHLGEKVRKRTSISDSLRHHIEEEPLIDVRKNSPGDRGLVEARGSFDSVENGGAFDPEVEMDEDEEKFKIIRERFSKRADWVLENFGPMAALNIAWFNSKLDILTSHVIFWSGMVGSCAAVAAVGIAAFTNGFSAIIGELLEDVEPVKLAVEIGVGSVILASFAMFKRILDHMQDTLLHRLAVRLSQQYPDEYRRVLEIDGAMNELPKLKGVKDSVINAMFGDIPIIGRLISKMVVARYDIKFEQREIMETYLLGEPVRNVTFHQKSVSKVGSGQDFDANA